MRIKTIKFFSLYNLFYSFPYSIARYEAARVGQSTDYTLVSVFGIKVGLYKDN